MWLNDISFSHVSRHTGGVGARVSPSWWSELLLWGISSGFPLANGLNCLIKSPYLVYLSFIPWVPISFSQDRFHQRGLWVVASLAVRWCPSPSDFQGTFLCVASWGVSWLWEWEMQSFTSPTWWTWVWVNCGSWRWTGWPGELWFMGLQRVGHDWETVLSN